ncbi:MAG: sigma-70 family RNA polymerase sigma factor [Planctomycetes bacterium]|nr:sigma-70 family RNA polymerase sigma factor [Planctomycetota bacterium]
MSAPPTWRARPSGMRPQPRPTTPAPGPDPGWRSDDIAGDHALVAAFLARDPMAEAEIERRLQLLGRMLGGLNRRMGGPLSAADLEDVAQETATVAIRKIRELPAGAPLAAWFYRICSFEFRNAVRRKRRTEVTSLDNHEPLHQDQTLAHLEQRESVLHALEQVRPDDATTIRMHHLDGLTFVEIAERLRTSVNTVKGRYYRGAEQLRGHLRREGGA